MDDPIDRIEQCVRTARRRLVVRQFAGRLAACLTGYYAVALVAVTLPKFVATPALPAWWSIAWLMGAGALGLLLAVAWTVLRPRSDREAAIEIDQRFGLRERVASTLSLDEATRKTPAGAALVRDAARAVERVAVTERFGFSLDRRAWGPLITASLAIAIATLVSDRVAARVDSSPAPEQVAEEQMKQAAEEARKRLRQRREEAERRGLEDATALLEKIERDAREVTKKGPADLTRAAVKLNDLSRELAERRERLAGGNRLRDQLNRLPSLGRGPAEKAADAMKRGDWKKALSEFDRLKQQLAKGDLSEGDQKRLAEQLGQLQQRLAEAAESQKQQRQELERQLAEAQRKGDASQAARVQQKLDRLAEKQSQQRTLDGLAQQMQQAQQALERGDAQQAQQAMDKLAGQMQQLQQAADELEMLDGAMTDIEAAKQAMGLCADGQCANPGGMAGRPGNQAGKGRGMGEGQGSGPRPDEENPVNFRDSRVRQNVGRGASTFGGLVRGPSIKGEVVESIKTGLTSEAVAPADPLTSQRLPRSRREHAEEYFRGLRESL